MEPRDKPHRPDVPDRGVKIERNANNSVIVTGDGSTVNIHHHGHQTAAAAVPPDPSKEIIDFSLKHIATQDGTTMRQDSVAINLDGLIRSMGVDRSCRHMVFLGAGASITSGILSAWYCIWRWKAEIFLSAQQHVSPLLLGDPSLPHVQDRIQAWLDATGGYPANGAPDEYQFYAERCYLEPRDRQKFFERVIGQGKPSLGYKLLSLIVDAGHLRWIWTTNFDDMLERARSGPRKRLIRQVGMDSKARILKAEPDDPALHYVFLHGDFRYDRLRNTETELQTLDEEFRHELVEQCRHYPLVMVGYSGRDSSVMTALESAYSQRGDGSLYWIGMRGSRPNMRVEKLIDLARANGRRAEFVESDGFDSFIVNLARYLLRDEPWAAQVHALIQSHAPPRAAFSLSGYKSTGEIIKSNSWPVIVPSHLYQFATDNIKGWTDLRELLVKANGRVCAGLFKGKVIAMGTQADILTCFGKPNNEPMEQIPVAPKDLFWEDGVVLSILREGLVRTLAARGELHVGFDGRRRWYLFSHNKLEAYKWQGTSAVYYRAALVRLEQRAGQLYMSLIPDRYLPENEQPPNITKHSLAPIKAALLGQQWNSVFNEELNVWRKQLRLGSSAIELVFPVGQETGFRYTIQEGPIFIERVDRSPRGTATKLTCNPSLYRFKAFELPEPELRFAQGTDVHPIRGLLHKGPVELAAGIASRKTELRLGVVCPDALSRQLDPFLRSLTRPHCRIETKREYLQEYPGFEAAFRLPLRAPSPRDESWISVPTRTTAGEPILAFQEIREQLITAIDRLTTSSAVDVVLIFIPASWRPFETVETETIDLDLHDQLKAYCAVRGIRTQILREATLTKPQRAEVLWWLALALYTKSMRTPWILARSQEDVAYVGIGHAIDRRNRDRPIVLGCSHVFQSNGIGLKFNLSQIQEPIWRRKSPYLGPDDALRVGLQTRQLFFESMSGRLPSRVLLCKRTPFIKEELAGLRAGLAGVASIDFLTLEYEPAWRCLACDTRNPKAAAPFPIRRGTAVLLDEESFYLWLHGRVERINEQGQTYFLGKTRIPTPVRVRRYGGSSNIEQIALDLLGLSKMDWNTFDLYEQMPAHVTTPGRIAQIGRLLQRLAPECFDYRLFM